MEERPATSREPLLTAPARPAGALERSRAALERVFGPPSGRRFRVAFWDGSSDEPDADVCDFTLRLTWPGALRRAFLPPTNLSVGEALVRGDLEVEGDLEAAVREGAAGLRTLKGSPRALAPLVGDLLRLPWRPSTDGRQTGDPVAPERLSFHSHLPAHSRRRDRLAVRFHYDLGDDFYRLFLDRRMQYSSAYFADPAMELEEAQEAKLDLICRKLRLRPDEDFLDVGCGWGGLLVHAVERYGVRGRGITLSPVQAAWAREAVSRAGLSDRCRIEVMDYRELPAGARFDKIASVGMIEHVGLGRYPPYFGGLFRILRPGGLLMNQGIVAIAGGHTRLDRLRLKLGRRWGSFIHRHIFPDSDLVPLGRTLAAAEAVGFETRSVEGLRKHYARTLRCWVRRLEDRWDEAVALAGLATCRAWRFYMAASAHLFSAGEIGVAQCLLARPGTGGREPSF